jgi:ATP diphosphatase
MTAADAVARLLEIMAALRTPATGCPWDVAQTSASIARYTIEEAYEVADAIARKNMDDLRDELGDLLLQVVFHSRIAEESGAFTFADVAEGLTAKLVRRHPHVFGNAGAAAPEDVESLWKRIKAEERAQKIGRRASGAKAGILADVPVALPALTRAYKLQVKAGEVGFDWRDARTVIAKIDEEAREIEAELADGKREAAATEVGDLLFAVANLARHLDVDPEESLRAANAKFESRFSAIERALAARGRTPKEASLDEMEELWNEAKAGENRSGPRDA